MLRLTKTIVVFLLLAAVGSSIHSLTLAADQPARTNKPALRTNVTAPIKIARIDPSAGDNQRIEQKRRQAGPAGAGADENQVHVIKIYVDMPTPGAQVPVFYVGDEKIEEYGSFAEGIFVKVYGVKQLQSWQGKPLRVSYRNELIDLKANIPARPASAPARLPPLREALQNGSPN